MRIFGGGAGPWPGNRWCAAWYVRCFDGPPRRPGAFPSGLARGRPGSCDRSRTCRSRARFTTGICAVLRLARAALVSGARRTADAERRRRPLSGSSPKLRLSAFAEPLSTALALAHGVQGQELADRVVTHHDLVGHRGDQRAAGGRADVGHESQLRGGQARLSSGMGTTATRRSIMTYCSTGPRCRVPGARPPAASAPRRGSARRRRRRWAGCGC